VQAGFGPGDEGVDEEGGGAAGAEADDHVGFDKVGGLLGGFLLL
jgi:hypothetical protein